MATPPGYQQGQITQYNTPANPSGIVFPFQINTSGLWEISSLQVDNGTAATIQIQGPGGSPFQTLTPYQRNVWTIPNWTNLSIVNVSGAALASTDVFNAIWANAPLLSPSSSYGPAGWSTAATPAGLTRVISGEQFFTWQINQFVDFLTGVTAGNITIDGSITAQGILATAFLQAPDLRLVKSGAPSTVPVAGQLYVDGGGALHYLSPTGIDTVVVAGP